MTKSAVDKIRETLESGADLASAYAADIAEKYHGYYPERHARAIRDAKDAHIAITLFGQLLAEYDAAVLALATACDHIEMSNLRISHRNDAAIIDKARGADHG